MRDSIKEAVRQRDQEQCVNCCVTSDNADLEVHHIVARSCGGRDHIPNLALLCVDCHRAQHCGGTAPTGPLSRMEKKTTQITLDTFENS